MGEIAVGAAGLLLGVLSIIWHILNASKKYLHINLSLSVETDHSISALTRVENKGLLNKKIDNALLLVGPESERPTCTFNTIMKSMNKEYSAVHTNDIAAFRFSDHHNDVDTYHDKSGRILIPLPFYYSENIGIADEILSYRASISTAHIRKDTRYSVRFFIHSSRRLHRSTQDSFLLHEQH